MKQNNKPAMSEREMLEDGVNAQKQISADYNSCAGVSSHKQLRTVFLNILAEEQELGAELGEEMNARGWQEEKQAQQSNIAKVKEKFS